jgi:protein-tyrosine phosphatase
MHGRIDVHAHLLPGVDDGCADVLESLACGRMLVAAGYTHAFCTPHIWPNLPHNNPQMIVEKTAELQQEYEAAGVPLKLFPGGELNLRPESIIAQLENLPTYCMQRKYCLFDLWCDKLPPFFWPAVEHLRELGMKIIVAHPERMRAVQEDSSLAEVFLERGLLLQGNLQCFSDVVESPTRRTVEKLLIDDRYFLLGTDTHRPETLKLRLDGLYRAIDLVGNPRIDQVTRTNPQVLLT